MTGSFSSASPESWSTWVSLCAVVVPDGCCSRRPWENSVLACSYRDLFFRFRWKSWSLKNGNDVHKKLNLVWVLNQKLNWRSISIKPKIGRDLNSAKMHFVPNLEIVTSIGGESWHGQAQNGVNFAFEVKFDLEGQGQSPFLGQCCCAHSSHISERSDKNWGSLLCWKLEQLECLHSENTPRRPMITYTMDSYQILCHNKTKSKLQITKNSKIQISKFGISQ